MTNSLAYSFVSMASINMRIQDPSSKRSAVRHVIKQVVNLFAEAGQTMRWIGIVGALSLALMWLAALIYISKNEGVSALVQNGQVFVTVMVSMIVAILLLIVWGRLRLMLGKAPLEKSELTLQHMPFGRALTIFLNALGIFMLVLIPVFVIGLLLSWA